MAAAHTAVRAGPRTRAARVLQFTGHPAAASSAAAAAAVPTGRAKRKAAAAPGAYAGLDADSDNDDDIEDGIKRKRHGVKPPPPTPKQTLDEELRFFSYNKVEPRPNSFARTDLHMHVASERGVGHTARDIVLLSLYRRRQYDELYRTIRQFKESGSWRLVELDGALMVASAFELRLDSALMDRPYRSMNAENRMAFAAMFELIKPERPLTAYEMQYLEQSPELLWLAASNGNTIRVENTLPKGDLRTRQQATDDDSKILSVMRKINAVRRYVKGQFDEWFVGTEKTPAVFASAGLPKELVVIVLGYCMVYHPTDTLMFGPANDLSNAELFVNNLGEIGPWRSANPDLRSRSLVCVRSSSPGAEHHSVVFVGEVRANGMCDCIVVANTRQYRRELNLASAQTIVLRVQ